MNSFQIERSGMKPHAGPYDPGDENMDKVRWIASEWRAQKLLMAEAIVLILLCILGGVNSAHFWSLVATSKMPFPEGLPRVVT